MYNETVHLGLAAESYLVSTLRVGQRTLGVTEGSGSHKTTVHTFGGRLRISVLPNACTYSGPRRMGVQNERRFLAMKKLKKVLSLVLVLAMCVSAFGVSAFAANYDDYKDADTVKTDYAANETAIDVVTGLKIINGDGGYLNLGNGLTRAEAAKILTVVDLGTKTADSVKSSTVSTGYTDMKGHWASGYVAYCTAQKFLAGNGDGTFEPDAELTGYAFGKMLLNVLGKGLSVSTTVNGTQIVENKYTGDLWEVHVLADGTEIDLFKDVTSDLGGAITRADAMQMTYNALKLVKTKPAGCAVAPEFKIQSTPVQAGLYGRPTTTVFVDKDNATGYQPNGKDIKLTTYENKLVATFTSAMTEGAIFDAIGAAGIQGKYSKYIVMDKIYEDGGLAAEARAVGNDYQATKDGGINETVIIAKGDKSNAAGFGNGVTVEIYETMEPNHYIMVSYKEYYSNVQKVTKANEAAGTKRTVTITGAGDFESETLNERDAVLYTMDKGKVATAKLATDVIEGDVSKITSSGVYTIGGKEYQLSQTNNVSISVGDKVSVYVDSNGYIIAEKGAAESVKYYGFVLDYATADGVAASNMSGRPASAAYEKIKLVTSEGKEVIFDTAFTLAANGLDIATHIVGNDVATYASNPATATINQPLVQYTLTADGKIATITAATENAGVGSGEIYRHTKGQTFNVVGTQKADDKTVIFFKTVKTDGSIDKVSVCVGYANLPAGTYYGANAFAPNAMDPNDGGAIVLKDSNNVIPGNNVVSTVYFATNTYTESKDPMGMPVRTYSDAYVDGVLTDVVMVAPKDPATIDVAAETAYVITTDAITGKSTIVKESGAYKGDAQAVSSIASGYYVIDDSVYYVDAKTAYYQINEDGTVSVATGLPQLPPDQVVKVVKADADNTTPAHYVYFFVAEAPAH